MKLSAEEKEQLSLIKERDSFIKKATRQGVPIVEAHYYSDMAQRVGRYIIPEGLRKKQKEWRSDEQP